MIRFAVAYLATAAAFFGLDFLWLSNAAPRLYRPQIGHLLADRPDLGYAAGFYALYVVGVVVFAVQPALSAGSWTTAAVFGALLGLIAYGTYDMTNLATLKDWPLAISLIDMAWGTLLTATAAVFGYFLTRAALG